MSIGSLISRALGAAIASAVLMIALVNPGAARQRTTLDDASNIVGERCVMIGTLASSVITNPTTH